MADVDLFAVLVISKTCKRIHFVKNICIQHELLENSYVINSCMVTIQKFCCIHLYIDTTLHLLNSKYNFHFHHKHRYSQNNLKSISNIIKKCLRHCMLYHLLSHKKHQSIHWHNHLHNVLPCRNIFHC